MIHQQRSWSATCRVLIMLMMLTAACSRDEEVGVPEAPDRNRIGYVLEDNFNFTVCNKLFGVKGYAALLKQEAVNTVLAPDNDAFLKINVSIYSGFEGKWYGDMVAYTVLPGSHAFRKMPLGDNQPLLTSNGNNVYISRYKEAEDTITSVNGIRIADTDIKASNGYLQVTTLPIQPETVKQLPLFLTGDTTLTLFALALERSGVMSVLGNGDYTILAPANAAMRMKGAVSPDFNLTSPDGILAADKVALADFVRYHVCTGRNFLDRIHHIADTSAGHSLTMLNGGKVTIGGDVRQYNSTTFKGNNNNTPVRIYQFNYLNWANCPAGSGVVHHIDNLLLP